MGGPADPQLTIGVNQNSCCYPEYKYKGWDDHVATDVVGAQVMGSEVLPYQIKQGDTEEHMPIMVNLSLPSAT